MLSSPSVPRHSPPGHSMKLMAASATPLLSRSSPPVNATKITIRFILTPPCAPFPPGCIEHSPENGKPATTRPSFASVAGRTTGSASSPIGCHVLQWDGLLGLYPYWPFLCHKDNYSNSPMTVHPLDGRVFGLDSIRKPPR